MVLVGFALPFATKTRQRGYAAFTAATQRRMTLQTPVTELIEDEKVRRVVEAFFEEKEKRLEDKEKRLEEKDHYYTALLEEKEERLNLLQVKILSLKGLLTARGVVEYFAVGYLKQHVIGQRRNRNMPMTDILSKAAELAYNEQQLPNDIRLLKDVYEQCVQDNTLHNKQSCSLFYKNLYAELSKEIHGAAWSGPGVKNTLLSVPNAEKYICVVAEICERKFNLSLDE